MNCKISDKAKELQLQKAFFLSKTSRFHGKDNPTTPNTKIVFDPLRALLGSHPPHPCYKNIIGFNYIFISLIYTFSLHLYCYVNIYKINFF